MRKLNFSKKIFIPFNIRTYEIRYLRKHPNFRIKSARPSNYRGTAFFLSEKKGKNMEFEIYNTQYSIRNTHHETLSTRVEKPLQITPFYAKQTQFFPVFNLKMKISPKNKPNSNPIKPNQTQYKSNQSQ